MQEITTAVNDEEVIEFFMKVIAPHVNTYQKPVVLYQNPALECQNSTFTMEKDSFVSRLSIKLESAVVGTKQEEVIFYVLVY